MIAAVFGDDGCQVCLVLTAEWLKPHHVEIRAYRLVSDHEYFQGIRGGFPHEGTATRY